MQTHYFFGSHGDCLWEIHCFDNLLLVHEQSLLFIPEHTLTADFSAQ